MDCGNCKQKGCPICGPKTPEEIFVEMMAGGYPETESPTVIESINRIGQAASDLYHILIAKGYVEQADAVYRTFKNLNIDILD